MHIIDYVIFSAYFVAMLSVGLYFFRKNKNQDDYYVAGRNMKSYHIGLSVVATDVGGGFSIGLGGLGFIMGLSGSWMLFTGLLGAWLSAVFLIPRVSPLARTYKWLTCPQMFQYFYNSRVALMAAVISVIGYTGFTSSQLLAGAKLASATFPSVDLNSGLILMGFIAVVYTSIGGMKAVIYTDTIQWIILMVGLIFVGIPVSYYAVGGYAQIAETLPSSFLSLTHISWVQLANWMITIIPIWFVGMTLYQRIYACKDTQTAQKAWYMAGLFEYPLMAFMGVILGLFARVAFINGQFEYLGFPSDVTIDAEMGLPLLLRTVLPVGFTGLMLSAYFSAIMSTADSCLMAASGHMATDIIPNVKEKSKTYRNMAGSQIITFVIGAIAILIAMYLQNVLELMLLSYAFMVSGLFIPVLAIIFLEKTDSGAALYSMLAGSITFILTELSGWTLPFELDSLIIGILASALVFWLTNTFKKTSF